MNILIITYQGDIAGSTNSISYLAKGLAEKGHNIYLGIRKESLLFEMMQGTKVKILPMTFKNKLDTENMRQIRDVVRKYDIQLINAQSSKDRYTTIFAKIWYKLDIKLVHTRRQAPLGMNPVKSWFYSFFTDKTIVVSHELKRVFNRKGTPNHKIQVIHNGIPKERYEAWSEQKVSALKQQLSILPRDVVIGCVSRKKHQNQLVRAMLKLQPETVLVLAGVNRGEYDNLADEIGLDKNRIKYAGTLSANDVLNIYRLFHVNVLPSTTDGFGLVLLEAMAMSCPVVATDFGGIKDVVTHNENGLLFENNNIDELAKAIDLILKDENLKQRLIDKGLETAYSQFEIKKTISNYERFFEGLIEG